MTVHSEQSDVVELIAREIGENRGAWDTLTEEEREQFRQDARDVLDALTEAGYQLLPPGGEVSVDYEWRVRFVDGSTEHTRTTRRGHVADAFVRELATKSIEADKQRRTVTTHAGRWEPAS